MKLTIEDLEAEVKRLYTELSWAREQASQANLAAIETKTGLRDQFAAAALTGFMTAVQSIQDLEDFKAEGAKVVWQIADSVLKARNG